VRRLANWHASHAGTTGARSFVEEYVVWFTIQSLVVIVPAFLLGLIVGALWWRRRKVHFGRSDAIAELTARHQAALTDARTSLDHSAAALAEKDDEIDRLGALVRADAAELDARYGSSLVGKNAEIAQLTVRLKAKDAALTAQDAALATRDAALADRDAEIADRDAALTAALAALAARDAVLTARDAEIAARVGELAARDDELGRLSAVIERAEATAATHRAELTARQNRLDAQAAVLADRDAEIARLSAAMNTVTAPAGHAAAVTLASEPTAPTPEQVAAFLSPLEATGADVTAAGPTATGAAAGATHLTDAGPEMAAPAATPVPEDDLERVDGIGPRIGSALRDAGIRSFRQLADADTATLQGALEHAGLRFAPSLPTWSRQAALLADGDESGFAALAEQLVEGRGISGTR
jgi:predicted flap endonuclease-1-like 5' DNA nuclease